MNYELIKENTKEGVSIVYMPAKKLWGVKLNSDETATFYSTFKKVVEHLEK